MIDLFGSPEQCCGCSACFSVCPKQAISMFADTKGYLFPEIDSTKCIECGLCLKVCPFKAPLNLDDTESKSAFGLKNKSDAERLTSSSGGIYIEAAKEVLAHGGVVYGVRQDRTLGAMHDRAETLEQARSFQGSKYVQSCKGDVFKRVKADLIAGREVLFTGTPCEVAGLKRYLCKPYDSLVTIDIICHGTPSADTFRLYLERMEKKYGARIEKMTYRNKEYAWRHQELWIQFSNGKIYHSPIWEDEFYRLFTGNYLLRDSCYSCPFASDNRPGDLTIGDFWNIANVNAEFEDSLGVSSVICNTERGRVFLTSILDRFDYFETTLDGCTQRNLQAPSPKPVNYDQFVLDWKNKGFSYCQKKYGSMGVGEKIRRKLSPVKKKILKIIGH